MWDEVLAVPHIETISASGGVRRSRGVDEERFCLLHDPLILLERHKVGVIILVILGHTDNASVLCVHEVMSVLRIGMFWIDERVGLAVDDRHDG